jgi:hypothetical protein
MSQIKKLKRLLLTANTLAEMAKAMDLTRQRVYQLAQEHLPKTYKKFLRLKKQRRKDKLAKKAAAQQQRYMLRYGRPTRYFPNQRERYIARAFRLKRLNALREGCKWDLERTDVHWPTHCPILGIELNYEKRKGRADDSPSFDQIRPGKGYVKGNVQIISLRANRIKNNGTAREHFLIWKHMKKTSQQNRLKMQ